MEQQKPTDAEMEVLLILWQLGQCTVRQVHDELAKSKDAGYTTTLKIMQNMFEKELIERDDSARSHLYKAVFTQEQAQHTALDKIINTVFKGSTTDLIVQALGQHRASKDEIDFLKNYLEQFKSEK
ncbi:hypothetical protein GCM10027049_18670 [Mucilaginibacter puniceus]